MSSTYALTIAGVAKQIHKQTLRLRASLNGVHTADFTVLSEDGLYRPALDAEVILTEDVPRIFGGVVDKTAERGFAGTSASAAIETQVTVVDFNVLATRRYVQTVVPAGTLKSQLQWLLPYLPGVTLDPLQVDGPALPEARLDYVRLDAAIDQIVGAAGYVREIDYSKVLRAYLPGSIAAPVNVTEASGVAIGDVTVEPTRDNYANRIIVRFNSAAVAAYAFLTASANFAHAETVVIGSRTYTFQDVLTDVNGNVLIGATVDESLEHLITAILADATHASHGHHATSTTVHSQVTALLHASGMVKVIASTPGAAGNSIGVSTTAANATWVGEGSVSTSSLTLGADQALTNTVIEEDTAAQAANGVYEAVITVESAFTEDAARTAGAAYLAQRLITRKKVRYRTFATGLKPGQTQTINLSKRGVNNTFLITDVETSNPTGNSIHRAVTAIEGTVFPGSWRDVIKNWSGGSSSVAVSTSGGSGSSGGSSAKVYFLGGSELERVRSATPDWVAASAVQVQIDTVARGTTAAIVVVRMKAQVAGVSVTARLRNVSDGVTVGTSAAVTSTAWQTVSFAVTLTAGAKFYELQLLPSAANERVSAVGYLE